MSLLLNGDCLEEMKHLDDDSVDLIFCDLPYGQTSCKWDTCIDLNEFWKQVMRVKKLRAPIFMTTTTKFGASLIATAPKKCPFRYDLVWVKSAPVGFLSAKKMPMKKHEMIYVFYEKLPFYDLSSHKHKFIKEGQEFEDSTHETIYGKQDIPVCKERKNGESRYDPPLPVSVVKKDLYGQTNQSKEDCCLIQGMDKKDIGGKPRYDPPLPTTMLEIKSTRGKHSTEKPVALMEWIFKYYSKQGDVILDPTMGSGSTGVACKNMNRNFIGIEKDPEIYQVAVNRIED